MDGGSGVNIFASNRCSLNIPYLSSASVSLILWMPRSGLGFGLGLDLFQHFAISVLGWKQVSSQCSTVLIEWPVLQRLMNECGSCGVVDPEGILRFTNQPLCSPPHSPPLQPALKMLAPASTL